MSWLRADGAGKIVAGFADGKFQRSDANGFDRIHAWRALGVGSFHDAGAEGQYLRVWCFDEKLGMNRSIRSRLRRSPIKFRICACPFTQAYQSSCQIRLGS